MGDDCPNRIEQAVSLALGKRGGWFIEHKQGAARAERSRNLDELAVRERQISDAGSKVDDCAKPMQDRLDDLAARLATDKSGRRRRKHAREDIFFHRAVRKKHKLLMNDRDARFTRLAQ
jgi:hypothetical protein